MRLRAFGMMLKLDGERKVRRMLMHAHCHYCHVTRIDDDSNQNDDGCDVDIDRDRDCTLCCYDDTFDPGFGFGFGCGCDCVLRWCVSENDSVVEALPSTLLLQHPSYLSFHHCSCLPL